jgi:hypothetical protein
VVGSSQRKSIPSAPERSVTPIRPWARDSGVAATHRQTSHVSPFAAVMRPATTSKPSGATPPAAVVVGAAVREDVDVAGVEAAVSLDAVDVLAGSVFGVAPAGTTAVVCSSVDAASSGESAHEATTSNATIDQDRHVIGATVGVSVRAVRDTSTCESCGAADEQLFAVHRQYITPAEWDTPGREVTLEEIEHWCYSCCTHYPHVLVES